MYSSNARTYATAELKKSVRFLLSLMSVHSVVLMSSLYVSSSRKVSCGLSPV